MIVNKYDVDEKNTSFNFNNIKRALKYTKKYKKDLFLVFVSNLIVIFGSLFWAKVIEYAIDYVVPSNNFKNIIPITIIEILVVIIAIFFSKVKQKLLVKVNQNIVVDLKNDLFSHVQYLSSFYFDTRPHGKILTRLTDYAENVSNLITNNLIDTIIQVFNLLLTIIFMLFTSVRLTFVTIIGVIILSLIFNSTAKIKRKLRMIINNKSSNMNAYVYESLKGIDTTRVFNREKTNYNINKNLTNDWSSTISNSLWYFNTTWASTNLLSNIINVVIYIVGVFVFFPNISIGVIVAMGSYTSRFWNPVRNIFSTIDNFIESVTYLERILETIDEPIKIKNKDNPIKKEISGDIEFKNVKFSYNSEKIVLNNLSFKIKRGSKIAIVGETGSGKTTIANLIARFYDIQEGEILIDGINIKDYDLNSLRKQISIMQQDNYLFSDTIMNNLKYGNNLCSDNEVIKVCKEIGVDDFVSSLPDKYDTVLENHGMNLSEGQRQLISYARILINNPKILVLDEATSKIDVKTEEILSNNISKVLDNKTTITIAHRLSTIVNCDMIMLVKDNKIFEFGKHSELMKLKKEYYKLYTSQNNLI